MKRSILLLGALAVFSSCDDGDLVYESLNFKDAVITKCDQNELYFKTNGHELLLIDFTGPNNTTILHDSVPIGQLRSLTTTTTNKILYRSYDGDIKKEAICSQIPPASPKVTAEYVSENGGIIEYMRNMEIKLNENTPNRFQIVYNYTINLKNITLNSGSSTLKYETYNFGTFQSNLVNSSSSTIEFNFNYLSDCGNNLFYGTGNNKLLQIQMDQDLPLQTGTYPFDLNTNRFITYKAKNTDLGNVAFCDTNETAGFNEIWKATSGKLIIVYTQTQQNGQNVDLYTFTLEKARFEKNGRSFEVNNMKLGELSRPVQ